MERKKELSREEFSGKVTEVLNVLKNDLGVVKENIEIMQKLNSVKTNNIYQFPIFDIYNAYDKFNEKNKLDEYKEVLKEALKALFGYEFFNMTKEEIKEAAKKYLYTPVDLKNDLMGGLGFNKVADFKIPESFDDFADLMLKVCEEGRNPNTTNKYAYVDLGSFITKLIASRYKEMVEDTGRFELIIYTFVEYINCVNNNRKMELTEQEIDKFKIILRHLYKKFNYDIIVENCFTEDEFVEFIDKQNKHVDNRKDIKEVLKLEKNIDKYYGKITKLPLEKLEVKNLPKFTNANFSEIMNGIINKVEKNINENDLMASYLGILYLHQFHYINSKVYQDKKDKGLAKTN